MCQELLKKKVFVVENKEGIVLSGANHKMAPPPPPSCGQTTTFF